MMAPRCWLTIVCWHDAADGESTRCATMTWCVSVDDLLARLRASAMARRVVALLGRCQERRFITLTPDDADADADDARLAWLLGASDAASSSRAVSPAWAPLWGLLQSPMFAKAAPRSPLHPRDRFCEFQVRFIE